MSGPDIQQIIDKYGRPVWEAALLQVKITIAFDIFWTVVMATIAVISILYLVRLTKRIRRDHTDLLDESPFAVIPGAIGSIFGTVVALAAGGEAINYWLNPTWAAIHVILKGTSN